MEAHYRYLQIALQTGSQTVKSVSSSTGHSRCPLIIPILVRRANPSPAVNLNCRHFCASSQFQCHADNPPYRPSVWLAVSGAYRGPNVRFVPKADIIKCPPMTGRWASHLLTRPRRSLRQRLLIDSADCRSPEALFSSSEWRSPLPLCKCDVPSRYKRYRMTLRRQLLLALQSDRHRRSPSRQDRRVWCRTWRSTLPQRPSPVSRPLPCGRRWGFWPWPAWPWGCNSQRCSTTLQTLPDLRLRMRLPKAQSLPLILQNSGMPADSSLMTL